MKKKRFTLRSAVYLILIKGNKTLLSRRYNTGWMDGKFSLIAGHLDGNESIYQAMIREAKEEAGIVVKKKDLIPATVLHRLSDREYADFFFVCKKWKGTPHILEANKCDKMEWFDLDKLPKNTLLYIRKVFENYKNKVAFGEYGW
jgi:8-oxo-dGTP diphosphatase